MFYLNSFLISFLCLFLYRKLAQRVGLVDKPNERKLHDGAVPLVGGLSVYTGIALVLFFNSDILSHADIYLLCASILVFIGVLDDRYDVDFKIRLIVQVFVSSLMMFGADLSLKNLGPLLFGYDLLLGPLGYVVTVFAVIGAINAFNMVDGIDGLLGGLSMVSFGSLAYIFGVDGNQTLAQFCWLIMVAMLPYVLLNLGIPFGRKKKVFMGDAGSMLIGFTVIWVLLQGSQGANHPIQPVTALWVIAIPLMDMAAIMIRRIRKGMSPFRPDRDHLHHICLRMGLSSWQTLFAICSSALLMAFVGIGLERLGLPDMLSLLLFVGVFGLYFFLLSRIWKIIAWIRRCRGMEQLEH